MKILILEDDQALAETVRETLSQFYSVDTVHNGREGSERGRNQRYDLLIMDIMLPEKDGVSVCRELRDYGLRTPILMLTARDTIEQKVAALDAGADDYLTKPFSFDELLARVRALLRRHTDTLIGSPIQIGTLLIDVVRHQVLRSGKSIPLRRKEFCLLEYLARHEGQVVTRTMILDHVWDTELSPASNTVDVHINYLREKIDRPFATKLIKTIPGIGYKLEA